jgi:Fe-S cluster assembly protein SufB
VDGRIEFKTIFTISMPEFLGPYATEDLHFDKILDNLAHIQTAKRSWDDTPVEIKERFNHLGIPDRERKFLACVETQFGIEAADNRIQDALGKDRIIFVESTVGLKNIRKCFTTILRQLFRLATIN